MSYTLHHRAWGSEARVPCVWVQVQMLIDVLYESRRKGERVMVFCNTVNSCRAVEHALKEVGGGGRHMSETATHPLRSRAEARPVMVACRCRWTRSATTATCTRRSGRTASSASRRARSGLSPPPSLLQVTRGADSPLTWVCCRRRVRGVTGPVHGVHGRGGSWPGPAAGRARGHVRLPAQPHRVPPQVRTAEGTSVHTTME